MSRLPTPPDPDKLDEAVAAFRRLPVPDPPPPGDVLSLLAASPAVPQSRRRMIVRIATWSLAASVFAAAGGLFLFGGSPTVALADVLKAAEKHKLVKYVMIETTESADEPKTATAEYVAYADLKAPRFRTERAAVTTLNGAVESKSYSVQDFARSRWLTVLTETATEAAADPNLDDALKRIVAGMKLPKREAHLSRTPDGPDVNRTFTLLDHLRELEASKDATAADERIDGWDAVKYTRTAGAKTTTLWVSKKTLLPVRAEMEIRNPAPNLPRFHVVQKEFEWDPKLAGFKDIDAVFDLAPPAGYKVTDETNAKK